MTRIERSQPETPATSGRPQRPPAAAQRSNAPQPPGRRTRRAQRHQRRARRILDRVPRWFYPKCRDCGLPGGDGVKISRRGYCPQCGMTRALDAAQSMITGTGEHHDRYRAAQAAGRVGRPRNGVGGSPD